MKKSLHHFLVQTLICVLLSVCANATTINVNIAGHDTINTCDTNLFHVTFIDTHPSGHVLMIHDSIINPPSNSCNGNGGNDLSALKILSSTPFGLNFYHDLITHTWKLNLPGNNSAITFDFTVFLDCGLVDTSSNAIPDFLQTWTDSIGGITYTLGTSGNHRSALIFSPSIQNFTPTQFYGNYLDTTNIYFIYRNSGSADAHISFMFNPNPAGNCPDDSLIDLKYAVGDTSSLSFVPLGAGWVPRTLHVDSFLVIRKTVIMKGCIGACTNETGDFRWKCNYTDTIVPFCDKCQQNYGAKKFSLYSNSLDTLGVKVTLFQPTAFSARFDTSCMNSKVQWEYHIVNRKRNVPAAKIDLFEGTAITYGGWGSNLLTLIDSTDLEIADSCNGCIKKITMYKHTNALCNNTVPVPFGKVVMDLKDFMKGDSVVVRYKTYRCCVENDSVLLDEPKYYNGWQIEAAVKDTCGDLKNNYVATSPNISASTGNFDQHLQFLPGVSDLTVPQDSIFGEVTSLLHVDLKGMIWDSSGYQFLGCTSDTPSTCTLSGYLRARIHCQKGLVVDTPFSHVNITSSVSGSSVTWNHAYNYKTIPDSVCEEGDFYFFFDLTNPNTISLLRNGKFNFRLRSCCYSGLDKSLYDISFHLIALPSTGCDSCALPMSSAGDAISVHCPGCINPGIIADKYRMERISFGAQDANNNRQEDIQSQLIDSAYLSNYKDSMNVITTHHGQILEDHLLAHFEPGNISLGGYTYVQMQDSNVFLKHLQMERSLLIGTDSVQIGLTPYYMKFYIDTPAFNAAPDCIDCGEYDSSLISGYRTVQIIEDSGASLNSTYIQTDLSRHSLFFTFSADTPTANLFQHFIHSDTVQPFHGFGENQRYRMLVRYRVCGYFSPPSGSQNDEDYLKKGEILNNMFLSGTRHGTDAQSTVPLAPSGIDSLPLPFTQAFADTNLFRCESYGGRFYFFSDQGINGSGFGNTNGNKCQKRIFISATASTGKDGLINNLYPSEYSLPAFEPAEFKVRIPPGYVATQAIYFTSYSNNGTLVSTIPRTLSFLQMGDSVIIVADSLHGLACLDENADSSLYVNEDSRIETIIMSLQTSICEPDSFYIPDSSNVIVTFRENTLQCAGPLIQNCSPVTFVEYMPYSTFKVQLPDPVLKMTMLPAQTTGMTNQVCWNFDLLDSLGAIDEAYNVFIVPPVTSNLTNWLIYSNGNTLYPDSVTGVIHAAAIMQPGTGFLNDSICASYVNCVSDTMQFIFGWDCNGFPASASDTVCFKDTVEITLSTPGVSAKGKAFAPSYLYDLCAPFIFSADYNVKSQASIYPRQFIIDSIFTGMTIDSVHMFKCNDSTDFIALNYSGNPYLWNITAADLDSIGIADSLLSSNDCISLQVFATPGCNTSDTLFLPELDLIALLYCGALDTVDAKFDSIGTVITWSGISECNDCFTLQKIALQDTVPVGGTATFAIVFCGNNNASYTLALTEYLPTDFDTLPGTNIPDSVTVPAQGCDTLFVSGTFNNPGSCPDIAYINTVQITNANFDTTATACINVIPAVSACLALTNIQIPNGAFSSSYGAGFSGDSILVLDTFYIDSAFYLNNCKVYMETGAQIYIMQGDTLYNNSSVIMGCTNMWRGIFLDTSSVYYQSKGSYVYDANWGVYASDQSKFFIHGRSGIMDCVRGVYVPPANSGGNSTYGEVTGTLFGLYASALKPDYPGQPPHGILPYAGIDLNDMVMTIGDNFQQQNEFYHLNNGVVGRRSRIVINNSEFSRVKTDTFYVDPFRGTAIVSIGKHGSVKGNLVVNPVVSGLSTVFNSHRGIYTDYSFLRVSGTDFINMNIGIYSTWCTDLMTTYVGNCTIQADRFGIKWEYNTGSNGMVAEYNTVNIRTAGAKGIYMSETNNTNPGVYYAYGNRIVMDSATFAIVARNCSRPQIYSNVISITGQSQALTKTEGISLRYCDNANVTCNTVKGEYPVSSDTTIKAIGTHISTNSFIACNFMDSTFHGALFGGICTGTQFKGNSINNHFDGLYLNKVAVIDTQTHAGNHWYGIYGSGYGAVNRNADSAQGLAFSLFVINPSDSTLVPNIPLDSLLPPYHVDNTGWFNPQPGGNTFECSTPNYSVCGGTRDDGEAGSDDLRVMIARDRTITSDFVPESKIIAKQFLFSDLKTDAALLASDTIFQNFISANETSSIGYLYDAKKNLKESSEYDSSFASFLVVTDSLIHIQSDSISYLDSLTAADSTLDFSVARQGMIDQVQAHQETMEDSLAARKDIVEENINAAETSNDLVQAMGSPDENERFINEMEIILRRAGINALLNYYEQILPIAQQCPYSGGGAVYRARAILEMMDMELDYDDETVCGDLGIYRQGAFSGKKESKSVQIIPNPADDKILILLNGTQEGICKIEITSASSSVILKDEMNCKDKSHSINTRNFTAGVYFVKVHMNDSLLKTAKLIIER